MRPIDVQVFPRWTVRGKRWFVRLVGVNGEKLMHSQAYKSFASAEHTAYLIAEGKFQVVVLQS